MVALVHWIFANLCVLSTTSIQYQFTNIMVTRLIDYFTEEDDANWGNKYINVVDVNLISNMTDSISIKLTDKNDVWCKIMNSNGTITDRALCNYDSIINHPSSNGSEVQIQSMIYLPNEKRSIYIYSDINQILIHGNDYWGWRLFKYSINEANDVLIKEDGLIWILDEGHDIGDAVRYKSGRCVDEPWSWRIGNKTFYPDWQ